MNILQYDIERDLAPSEVSRLPTLVAIVNAHETADAYTICVSNLRKLARPRVHSQCSTELNQIDSVHLLCCKTQTGD
jgi:hypothetical protein